MTMSTYFKITKKKSYDRNKINIIIIIIIFFEILLFFWRFFEGIIVKHILI